MGDFLDIFKNIKHRKPSGIFCPRCASPKIHSLSSFDLWLTPQSYVCDECGYKGLLVMELDKNTDEKEEET
ncbi:MAG: transposase [Nitrososphaerota archaeon]|jgi:DNA-directed RNA polymerase subunit RPC12/RpoP|nr:transposase [Nitrososphaerota archaeon]